MVEFVVKYLGIYLGMINLFELFLMYYDKRQAQKRKWRVSESLLLTIGIIGGGLGGLLGQQMFRHKTKKFYFYVCYILGTIVAFGAVFFATKYN